MSDEDYVDKHLKRLVEKGPDTLASLRAEVEQLKDANAQLQEIVNGDTEEEERLRAENERLRAALEEIVRPGGADGFWECVEIARAALEEKQ